MRNQTQTFKSIKEHDDKAVTTCEEASHQGSILVVDDEIDVLAPLCDFLSESGYKTVRCLSCKEALEALKTQEFDLLLADLVMAEIDGIELLKAALKIDPLLVGIIITGHGTIETALKAIKIGAFDYILKPLDFKTLNLVLSRAMKVRRLQKAEEKYRLLFDNTVEGIYQMTADRWYITANQAFAHILGYKSPTELLVNLNKKGHQLYVDPIQYEEFGSQMQTCNTVLKFESQVYREDGSRIWISEKVNAVCDIDNKLLYYVAAVEDITERKELEEALHKDKETLRLRVKEIEISSDIAASKTFVINELNQEIETLKEQLKRCQAFSSQSFYHFEE